MCLVVTCRERADLLALVCGVQLWVYHFPICILGHVWYLIVSIPDVCNLIYYDLCGEKIMWLIILSGIILSMNLSGYIIKWLNISEATFLCGKSYIQGIKL